MHHKVWLEYCDSIHVPQKLATLPSPVKITLLTLVDNYKTEADIFPTHKKIFFKCTTLQYSKWSIKELQRWLSTARKIIQRYKLNKKQQVRSKINSNHSTILDTNIYLPFQSITTHHIIIKAKKKNHLKASPIIKHYQSSVPKLYHNKPIHSIPTEPNTKIATGTSHENVVTDKIIPITTVVVPEYHKQKFSHELIKNIFQKIILPHLNSRDCTKESERNQMTKKIIKNNFNSYSTKFSIPYS